MRLITRAIGALLLASVSPNPTFAQPVIVEIGPPTGYADGDTQAKAVSRDGKVTIGNYRGPGGSGYAAIVWKPETGSVVLPQPAGWYNTSGVALAECVGTTVACGFDPAAHFQSYTVIAGTPTPLTSMPAGAAWVRASAISADGSVIVGDCNPNSPTRWVHGTPEVLPAPPGMGNMAANCLSADGTMVAGYGYLVGSPSTINAILWRPSQPPLKIGGLPAEPNCAMYGIDRTGSVMAGQVWDSSGYGHAAMWTLSGGVVSLGLISPEDLHSTFYAMSDDGRTAVGMSGGRAAIWRHDRGFEYLSTVLERDYGVNLDGWNLMEALGVSSDGRIIVGRGRRTSSFTRGWTVELTCYANCDGSNATPILNVNDFQCFLTKFAAGEFFSNCDCSSAPPIFNANDFQCFLNQFAAGCS